MKILLIDDEFEKTQAIIAALVELGLNEDSVVHRTNAREARVLMRDQSFDVALIDLQLPDMIGGIPHPNAGFQLFDTLLLDQHCKLPDAVIFITSKEDLSVTAEMAAAERGNQILFYQAGEQKWKFLLQNKIRYLLARKRRAPVAYENIDIAVITAMRSELDAVLALPYGWTSVRFPGNAVGFNRAEVILADGSKVSLIAASAFTKGMPSSSALAAQMCILFRPKYIVMLGICAGVKKHTSIGDVIVADPSFDWGSGKIAQNSGGDRVFMASPEQQRLNTNVSEACVDLSKDTVLKGRIRAGWNGRVPDGEFKIQVGPMASGASVLANIDALKEIAGNNRDLIAVEMEAYAVMAAAQYAISPAPIAVAIKSVCDFADADKGDDWQRYAAYTSAAFFNEMLQSNRLQIS